MPDIITSTEYPQVRAAIDVTLTSTVLPDAVIALDIYEEAAEIFVADLVPGWEALTGDDAIRVKNAVVYTLAALLLPAVPQFVSERSADGQAYARPVPNLTARVAELRARAAVEIEAITVTPVVTADRPTTFAVAHGYRGR